MENDGEFGEWRWMENFLWINGVEPHRRHDEPVEHWLAVYFDKDVEYLDSLGLFPLDSRLENYLSEDYVYNTAPMQQNFSNACGFYCIYYILHRARGHSMVDIIDTLKRSDGDFVVKDYLY